MCSKAQERFRSRLVYLFHVIYFTMGPRLPHHLQMRYCKGDPGSSYITRSIRCHKPRGSRSWVCGSGLGLRGRVLNTFTLAFQGQGNACSLPGLFEIQRKHP